MCELLYDFGLHMFMHVHLWFLPVLMGCVCTLRVWNFKVTFMEQYVEGCAGTCPTVVISVFNVGIMLRTKNDCNDSDLSAWFPGFPQHENRS